MRAHIRDPARLAGVESHSNGRSSLRGIVPGGDGVTLLQGCPAPVKRPRSQADSVPGQLAAESIAAPT